MDYYFYLISLIVIVKDYTVLTTMAPSQEDSLNLNFGYCIQQKPSPGVVSCFGRHALNALQNIEEAENFTITKGLTVIKDDKSMSRSLPNFLEQDPMDFR